MIDFIYQNPTKIIFGNGSIEKLSSEILNYGTRVLLVYGGYSIKDSGLYDCLVNQLKRNEIEYQELPFVTIPGSGSEMDGNSEIVDIDRGVNGSIGSFEKTYPRFSILDLSPFFFFSTCRMIHFMVHSLLEVRQVQDKQN